MQSLPTSLFNPSQVSPPDIAYRIVVEDDLRPLHATCYTDKTLAQFRDHFEKLLDWQTQNRCCWIAACDVAGKIVGSGQLILHPHGSELANLVVAPARRNEGIGTALVDVLTAVAQHLKLSSLEIGVAKSNSAALRLYQRLGFTIDRQLNLPNQEPAIILHKPL